MIAAPVFRPLARGALVVACACSMFLAVVLTTACGSETSPETDRAALALLYEATDGPNWIRHANWLSDAPMDQWEGVTTDEDGRVIGLDLYRNNVSGVIPTDVGNLDKLRALNVANTSDHVVTELAEIVGGFANLVGTLLSGGTISGTKNPPEYNDLYGCLPSRLQGQLDTEQSNLDGLPFCDGTNEADNTNTLALEYAVLRGDTAAAQRLLRDGVDVACTDDSGATPLHAAVAQGNVEITRMLVQRCSEDLDEVTSDSLYQLALREGTPALVQALFDGGVDIPCSSDSDPPLLHRVVGEEDVALTRMVVEQCSADVNVVSESYFDEQTPLSLAIGSRNEELVRILIEAGADPNATVVPDYEVGSHLAYAVEEGDVEIVRLLLKAGADPNVSDTDLGAPSYRATPLDRAYHNDRSDLVRVLLEAGADIGDGGDSMLAAAINSGRAEVVSILVEAGADVNGSDARGRSMLERAILHGSAAMVDALIEAGADANATNADGDHILFDAILHGNAETVRTLVAAGADANATNNDGESVLFFALLLSGADGAGIVKALVEAGADANATDDDGEPVLFHALSYGSAEAVGILVDAGADVNAKDRRGRSVLDRAQRYDNPEVVRILVNAGAKE